MANGAQKAERPAKGILSTDGMPIRALLDSLTMGVCAVDRVGRLVALNPEAGRILGWTEASAQGESLHELLHCAFHVDGSDKTACPITFVLKSGQPVWVPQVDIRCRDGATKSVEYKCVPLGTGGDLGALVTLRDLSHQLQLEADRIRLASIPEESPFPIVELDADANLLYANPAMTELLERFTYNETGLPTILPPDTPEIVRGCLTSGVNQHGIEVTREGVSYSWVFSPIPSCEQVRAYGIDVSKIRRAERDLQEFAQQMERANVELEVALQQAGEAARIKAFFLATMSHELRTPMNGVIGLTGFLLDTELTPEQRSYVELVQQSGEALLMLINDILDVSKMEAGKLELECIEFQPAALVDEQLGVFAERAQRKGVELVGFLSPDVPQVLMGDPGRLRQILTNLIGNALKFTEQGEVVLELRLEEEKAGSTGSATSGPQGPDQEGSPPPDLILRCEVRDTGIGIGCEASEKLFRAFSQADSSTTRKYGGTGLGLAICKELVELMGGRIGVDSRPGSGSTFWFVVPLRKAGAETSMSASPSCQFGGKRVLIVDDSPAVCASLTTTVGRWGVEACTAKGMEEALEVIQDLGGKQRNLDAVIIDFMLPNKSAMGLVQEITSAPGTAGVPLIMAVGFGQRAHEVVARQAGLQVCLAKPIRTAILADSLVQVWGLNPPAAPTDPRGAAGATQASGEHGAGSASQSPAPVKRRILVIEDNAVNQKVAVRMLEKQGYLVDVAHNGREGLEAWSRGRYDAVLMDCQMPEMDGFEATAAIRNAERGRLNAEPAEERQKGESSSSDTGHASGVTHHTPIIAMTANAMDGDRERCLAAGMDDYIDKPVKSEKLRSVLDRWLPSEAVSS